MDLFNKIRWEKGKYFLVFSLTLVLLVLIVSHYKNEDVPINKKEIITYRGSDVKIIKDFFFSKVNSPFLYNNYEIKKGDTIEKITKFTGIKAVVDAFTKTSGNDCGCEGRKEWLNNKIPYRRKTKGFFE